MCAQPPPPPPPRLSRRTARGQVQGPRQASGLQPGHAEAGTGGAALSRGYSIFLRGIVCRKSRGAHKARRAGVRSKKGPQRMKTAVWSVFLVKLMGYPPYFENAEYIFCTGLPRFSGWMRVLG